MAKKPEPKEEPTLSNLPMPQSDTPLVIDLPDGQKLVVGKLEEGSVIEVATWRGTGRPDSRTNRLMLGMSKSQNSSSTQPTKNSDPNITNSKKQDNYDSEAKTQKLFKFNIPFVGSKSVKLPRISSKNLNKFNLKAVFENLSKTKDKLLVKSKELAPVESVAELDVDQWLANIKRDAEAKVSKKITLEKSRQRNTGAKKPGISKNSPKKAKR
jgi:hypothetical protein